MLTDLSIATHFITHNWLQHWLISPVRYLHHQTFNSSNLVKSTFLSKGMLSKSWFRISWGEYDGEIVTLLTLPSFSSSFQLAPLGTLVTLVFKKTNSLVTNRPVGLGIFEFSEFKLVSKFQSLQVLVSL